MVEQTMCWYWKAGYSIILMGDLGQLPPVSDRPMYIAGSGSVISDHGHSLDLMFDFVIILHQIMCQAGQDQTLKQLLFMLY